MKSLEQACAQARKEIGSSNTIGKVIEYEDFWLFYKKQNNKLQYCVPLVVYKDERLSENLSITLKSNLGLGSLRGKEIISKFS